MGTRMHLKGLPKSYDEWTIMHKEHLQQDLVKGDLTIDLYKQYLKHLGALRYWILLESQKMVVPDRVSELLKLGKLSKVTPLLWIYKLSRKVKLDWFLKSILLPPNYKKQIKDLDIEPT
jgi:hypothetical protein